ncbi:DUF4097 family beta strand repeat-containing protein [Microbacterium sp. NPDC089695]|uniref:DUF4097 family beta strand repeat-containing protein n=1 Tax=Microbacterium sp. NPDC089695 TaxID=3364198 RepID=UPI0038092112
MSTEQNSIPDDGAARDAGNTSFTPPPTSEAPVSPPSPAAPSGDSRGRGPGVTAVLVGTAVIGGIALIGAGGTAAVAATGTILAASSERSDSLQTTDADGVTSIDLDVDAGNMRIEFGDVDEAELSVANGRSPGWTLDRQGDELVVRSPEFRWGWWFGGWFGDEESAVLTLPADLQQDALDATMNLDAGSLDVVGEFGALDITVNAGALDVEGAATSLAIDMSAGRADVVLDGVDDADLGVSAGDMNVELTGSAPTRTAVDVSAGSVDLTLPDTSYALSQDVSAGSLDPQIDQSSGSSRTIEVTLSAGSVTIRPGE